VFKYIKECGANTKVKFAYTEYSPLGYIQMVTN